MTSAPGPESRVPGEERVFSLILALVASPQGLTKTDLLSSVYGYGERRASQRSRQTIERQFERDKDQVRLLGIPIETIDSPLEPGNNQLTRYRISRERLQLPPDVRFTADELTVLRLASLAWSDGSLGAESRWASMKLTSLGAGLDVRHLGIAPRIGIIEPSAAPLQLAIDGSRIARFSYQLPGRDSPRERRVAPLRLHRAEGRWHLIAHDLDYDAQRIFLLSRIASEVIVENSRFEPELMNTVDQGVNQLLALREQQRVSVAVRRGSAAEARLAPRVLSDNGRDATVAGTDFIRLEFGTLDMQALGEELVSFGDEVQVVGPPELRQLVISLLRSVRELHSPNEPTNGNAESARAGDHHV